MIDLVAIGGAIGSSGVAVLLYNYIQAKKVERTASRAEARIEKREPAILAALDLNNTKKVIDVLQEGLDGAIMAKKRQADDFLVIHTALETNVTNLTAENARLQKALLECTEEITRLRNTA